MKKQVNKKNSENQPKQKKKEISLFKQIKNLYKEWKITLWISFFVFLAFYMKLAEEGGFTRNQVDEDLYDILGLTNKAEIKDIKKKFNKLVNDFHPDKNPNCTMCEEKFNKISKAYEVLSNPESKSHYDQTNGVL